MIRIGFNNDEKKEIIHKYIKTNSISSKVFILYFDYFKHDYGIENCEYVEYKDTIEYAYFYRLIEEIDKDSLIIIDEMMRTSNRHDLTYNCIHHFLNQTKNIIIFEYFPFIKEVKNFMILLDFLNKNIFKGKSFDYSFFNDIDFRMKEMNFKVQEEIIAISEKQKNKYLKKRDSLFETLGNKEPDTVPRNLHLYSGDLKKMYINPQHRYIARNKRFKMDNVSVFKDFKKADYIIDFPHKQIVLNDWLKKTGTEQLTFLNTKLSVDVFYYERFKNYINNIKDFYVKTSISK